MPNRRLTLHDLLPPGVNAADLSDAEIDRLFDELAAAATQAEPLVVRAALSEQMRGNPPGLPSEGIAPIR